jgi:hypothetical protein
LLPFVLPGILLPGLFSGTVRADAGSKIIPLVVDQSFEGKPYQMLWLRDLNDDLALGINQGDFKDSMFGTRLHDGNTGPREYSCFPDTVVYVRHGQELDIAYAGYLRWKNSWKISDDGSRAVSSYHHTPEMGLADNYIEGDILKDMRNIRGDITVTHELRQSRPYDRTTVTFRNSYSEPVQLWWLHQDGVFLYLPNQNQKAVSPVGPDFFNQFHVAVADKSSWIGSADLHDKTASILFSPQAKYVFSLPYYLGIRGFLYSECAAKGYHCNLGGNDRFVVRDHRPPDTLIADSLSRDRSAPAEGDSKIHGLIIDAGRLQPGQTTSFSYYTIAVPGAGSAEEVQSRAGHVVQQILSDADENRAHSLRLSGAVR